MGWRLWRWRLPKSGRLRRHRSPAGPAMRWPGPGRVRCGRSARWLAVSPPEDSDIDLVAVCGGLDHARRWDREQESARLGGQAAGWPVDVLSTHAA